MMAINKVKFGGMAALVGCPVVVLFVLCLGFSGCGKTDTSSSNTSSSGESAGGTSGESAGGTSTVESPNSVPVDTLVVKGLYVGMPGDDAVEACKKMVASSGDLVAVDFRNGIEREKDVATKEKEKTDYEEKVKLAESDFDRFMKWNSLGGEFYTPSESNCGAGHFDEKNFHTALGVSKGGKLESKIHATTVAKAMVELAGKHGYQVEWMLPGKRKGKKQEGTQILKLFQGKVEVTEKHKDESPYSYWKAEVLSKGLGEELYDKGLQIPKENKERAFFRLVLEDAQGNPVDKKKLAEELVLNAPKYFKDFASKQEKLEAAEKEVDGFLIWVEFYPSHGYGGGMSGLGLFDPEDPRPECDKEDAVIAKMVQNGDVRGLERMRGKRGNLVTSSRETQGKDGASKSVARRSNVQTDKSTGKIVEINEMKAKLRQLENKKIMLEGERKKLLNSMKMQVNDVKRIDSQAPSIRKSRSSKQRRAEIVKRYNEDKIKFNEVKEEENNVIAAIDGMRRNIEIKEAEVKREIAAKGKAIAEKKAAEKRAVAEKMAAEERAIAKKYRTDLKFLTAARTSQYDCIEFATVMMKMAINCKVMLEWAVLTVPADEWESITETIVIPPGDFESAGKFIGKLETNLGRFSENTAGSDGSRKRLFFEKDLEDVGSPLWFRLVLKNTNGVAVAKADVVKNWLAARGHFPPSDKVKIAKKNLIQISFKNDKVREDKLTGLCFVWIDDNGNVKEIYFTDDGMARIFNAGDLTSEEFAQSLVDNYSQIPSLELSVQTLDPWKQPGRGYIEEKTWIHKAPKGYKVMLYECAYIDNIRGKKFTSDKKLFDTDAQLSLALAHTGKRIRKYFDISAIKSESERKFD